MSAPLFLCASQIAELTIMNLFVFVRMWAKIIADSRTNSLAKLRNFEFVRALHNVMGGANRFGMRPSFCYPCPNRKRNPCLIPIAIFSGLIGGK